jgi:hypothetical protein
MATADLRYDVRYSSFQDPALKVTIVILTSQVCRVSRFMLMTVRYREMQMFDSMMFILSFSIFHHMVQKLLWVDTGRDQCSS